MYIGVKKKQNYFLVRMKEACGDALSLEAILSFKKILKESWLLQMVTCGRCWTFEPHIFLIDDSDAEFHPD